MAFHYFGSRLKPPILYRASSTSSWEELWSVCNLLVLFWISSGFPDSCPRNTQQREFLRFCWLQDHPLSSRLGFENTATFYQWWKFCFLDTLRVVSKRLYLQEDLVIAVQCRCLTISSSLRHKPVCVYHQDKKPQLHSDPGIQNCSQMFQSRHRQTQPKKMIIKNISIFRLKKKHIGAFGVGERSPSQPIQYSGDRLRNNTHKK